MSLGEHRNVYVSDHRNRKEKNHPNPDETAFVACEKTITRVLQLGEEMERGYLGIYSGIEETGKEEMTSLSGPCYLQCDP